MAAMASPSRITTRSTPRTSRALALMPRRRAAPTRASAASEPGQVTSSDIERPGSVSEPWARKAPRHTAVGDIEAADHGGGQAAHGAAAAVDQPGLPGQRARRPQQAHDVAGAAAQAAGGDNHELGR
jgi:hypothetical protein